MTDCATIQIVSHICVSEVVRVIDVVRIEILHPIIEYSLSMKIGEKLMVKLAIIRDRGPPSEASWL